MAISHSSFGLQMVAAIALCGGLAGCGGSPEITACESYIREKIATPASFKVVSTSSVPSTGESITGLTAADAVKLVSIEYDAANQYGAPVRSTDYCAFVLKGGKLPSSSELQSVASSAAFDAKLAALKPIYSSMDEGDLVARADALEEGKTIYGCCLPEKEETAAGNSH